MDINRRSFMSAGAALFASAGLDAFGAAKVEMPKDKDGNVIAGFDETYAGKIACGKWEPFSDKKVRVGIAGHGLSKFGVQFGYESHPNVEVVACTDLRPAKCNDMAARLIRQSNGRIKTLKQFKSCEEMIKEMRGKMDAVYIATDPPSHAPLAILAMENGMHAVSAVPAFWGDIQEEYAQKLIDTVKKTGMTYQMNETTAFRPETFAMRAFYIGGAFGKMIYTEGEYWHFIDGVLGSYNGWRNFVAPQWYCTHGNGFYTTVTHGSFTKCACLGMTTENEKKRAFIGKPGNFGNTFATEIALLRTSEGGIARMARTSDSRVRGAEAGRCIGTRGGYANGAYSGAATDAEMKKIFTMKPPLPPGMSAGGHGGSHGYLTDDFIRSILLGTKPVVDVVCAVNTTLPGIYMHRSAQKDGEWLNIPQVTL